MQSDDHELQMDDLNSAGRNQSYGIGRSEFGQDIHGVLWLLNP